MARMVDCVKFGREMEGLDAPPMRGEMGQRIYESVSKDAWDLWKGQSVLVINHYGLNMADPSARQFLKEQMEAFFFAPDARLPEDWTPQSVVQSAK
jgi:Fe-S cluster biosynthesis and repair protein YggX